MNPEELFDLFQRVTRGLTMHRAYYGNVYVIDPIVLIYAPRQNAWRVFHRHQNWTVVVSGGLTFTITEQPGDPTDDLVWLMLKG
jgi:hypothetical protein